MGLGYPRRFTRPALGPHFRNTAPVDNPETELDAQALNAMAHQIAGINLAVATRATIIAEWTGSDFTVRHAEEAWNARQSQDRPLLARSGVGAYSLTFGATYLDEDDTERATSIVAARCTAMADATDIDDRCVAFAWVDGLVVHVRVLDKDGAAADAPFWLEVA